MPSVDSMLEKAMLNIEKNNVFCFLSSEDYLLHLYTQTVVQNISKTINDVEITSIDGANWDLGQLIEAVGTISFFSTKRVVILSFIPLYSMAQEEIDALADVLQTMENAIVVITVPLDVSTKISKGQVESKKTKAITDIATKQGVSFILNKPTVADTQNFIKKIAKNEGCEITDQAVSLLLEQTGSNTLMLENEIKKFAASVAYQKIDIATVNLMGVKNMEADVFAMIAFLNQGKKDKAFAILQKLLITKNEPIAIAGAITSSFIDMLRVKIGQKNHKSEEIIAKEMRYGGAGGYRLKKAKQTAEKYTLAQLKKCIQILNQLDKELKSTTTDNAILLQTAMVQISLLKG